MDLERQSRHYPLVFQQPWKKNLKILYVARTHRQHDRVMEELKAISSKRAFSGISIRGRHEMCLNNSVTRSTSDARSAMEACEFLKLRNRCQYFRRIEEKSERARIL